MAMGLENQGRVKPGGISCGDARAFDSSIFLQFSYQNFKKPQQHSLVEFIQTVADFSQKNADVLLNILRLYFNTLIPYYITLVAT
jgi:hypothetical protein